MVTVGSMELVVHDTPEEVAREAASYIAGLIAGSEERFTLGLAGGSTPVATHLALRGRVDGWDRVHCWLSDERWVRPDDERSNGRMAEETLIDRVEAASFDRPRWSPYLFPKESAVHYEARLRHVFSGERPDLIMLGMGADGHTASLFPGTRALEKMDRWYVSNEVPQLDEDRLTATYPLLWSARVLVVLTTGEAKAEALRDSFAGKTPAGRLGEGDAEVKWFIDREAASLVA